ncbi:MAG: ATP-binding cassette domain-containing protein [Rhodospirillaceae bacterium]|nr:ATP-binding cassette domain-containing protein [Rhodospirillaceae bacterium]
MSIVAVTDAVKKYDAVAALDGVTMTFRDGEFFGLLGPSGSGKTTLLRAIAGFVTLDRGQVLIDGRDVGGVPVHARNIGMMFQNYALFPHMSVAENVAFGLEVRGQPREEVARRIKDALAWCASAGWHNWGKVENEATARYAEYGSTGPGANPEARVKWSKQLTADEAKRRRMIRSEIDCGATD